MNVDDYEERQCKKCESVDFYKPDRSEIECLYLYLKRYQTWKKGKCWGQALYEWYNFLLSHEFDKRFLSEEEFLEQIKKSLRKSLRKKKTILEKTKKITPFKKKYD